MLINFHRSLHLKDVEKLKLLNSTVSTVNSFVDSFDNNQVPTQPLSKETTQGNDRT